MQTMKLRISRTAQRLFLADGVDGVSMRKIAGEVGVSATAIYRHFRDKDELLDEITDAGFAIFEDYLERGLRAAAPGGELEGIFEAYLDFALEHPRHYDFIFIIPRKNVRKYSTELAQRGSASFNMGIDAVEQAMRRGRLRVGNPTELALTLTAHLHGLVALHRAGRFDDEQQFRVLFHRSIRHLLDGIEIPETGKP